MDVEDPSRDPLRLTLNAGGRTLVLNQMSLIKRAPAKPGTYANLTI